MLSLTRCLVAACVVVVPGIEVLGQEQKMISPVAQEIHDSGMLFDGHNDLPWQIRKLAGGSLDKLDLAIEQPELHTDLPKLAKSGLKAQFWSVYVSGDTLDTNDSLLRTLEQIDIVERMIKKFPDHFELAQNSDDILRIVQSGKIASMMGVEGGHSMEESLETLRRFHDRGVRYMTLTHNRDLSWVESCLGDPNKGLSAFGEDVVREMNRLGMLVDLSHVSDQTMRDTLRVTRAPVIFSHSSARAICDHPRNVSDEILKMMPKNGGVVMINFFPKFTVPTEVLKEDKEALGDLNVIVDHIEHVIRVAGIDHVGIGSDYDGVTSLPVGLEDVTKYPYITQELVNRGYSKEEIHKILGGNVFRALQQAEEVSRQMAKE